MSNYLLKPGPLADANTTPITNQHPAEPELDVASLSELNLEDELLIQYKAARTMLHLAKNDVDTPLNQKAQILNTIYTILSGIIKLQESLHNVESLKLLESCLIDTLKEFEPIRDNFLERYSEVLESKSASGFKRTIQEKTAVPVPVQPLSVEPVLTTTPTPTPTATDTFLGMVFDKE